MSLRCQKGVAAHLLLENVYKSNLLSDISKDDYLAENGLPFFFVRSHKRGVAMAHPGAAEGRQLGRDLGAIGRELGGDWA